MFDYNNLFFGGGYENVFVPPAAFTTPPPKVTPETCLLMLNKIRTEKNAGLYESGGEVFKSLMSEFEKTIEAFLGSYMVLLTIYSYQLAQGYFV